MSNGRDLESGLEMNANPYIGSEGHFWHRTYRISKALVNT